MTIGKVHVANAMFFVTLFDRIEMIFHNVIRVLRMLSLIRRGLVNVQEAGEESFARIGFGKNRL